MTHFNRDFNEFFIELAANNHKDWFDENRDRYHRNIKKPFEDFVAAIVSNIRQSDPDFDVDVPKSIFRINRDIRFSKDKAPYKLNRSAFISPYGKKDNRPGLYVQLGPEKVMVGGGVFSPDADELMRIRKAIAASPKDFTKALSDKSFKKVFGELQGKENKRLPNKELTAAAEHQPLIYKKQFYYFREYPPEMVTDPNLVEKIVGDFRAAASVNEFLLKAMR